MVPIIQVSNKTLRGLEKNKYKRRFDLEESEDPPILVEPKKVFILKYDNFGRKLIAKSNEIFAGTKAEISVENLISYQEIPDIHILERLALTTTLHEHYNSKILPITPLQSEQLLKQGKLPGNPEDYWEELALILFSQHGRNVEEAIALYQSLEQNLKNLKLNPDIFNEPLLIIHAGLEPDSYYKFQIFGVRPIIIPGLTKIIAHPSLKLPKDTYTFDYGLDNGLPGKDNLGKGNRTFCNEERHRNGLSTLDRVRGGGLVSGRSGLADPNSDDGRMVLVRII